MNYSLTYSKLIERAKSRSLSKPYETHHIKPKSLGGSNSKDNLVRLTPREHYIAHWLLVKITKSSKMVYAFWKMNNGSSGYKNSNAYSKARENFIEAMKKPMPLEQRIKIGLALKGQSKSKEHCENISKRFVSLESRQKMSESHKGMKFSAEHKDNLRKAKLGKSFHTDESRSAISTASKQRQRTYPHWACYNDLLDLWLVNDKPGRKSFRKIAVSNGFPDVDYASMVREFVKV